MSRYYADNGFLRFLRFVNILEPDNNILSISKIFMWFMLGVLVFVMITMPHNLGVIISAIGANFMTTLNYGYRRWIQYRREETGKVFPDVQTDSGYGGSYGGGSYVYEQMDDARYIDDPDQNM